MIRQKPRVNKIIPDRLMLDNWNLAYKILIFNGFFAFHVQATFKKKKIKPNQTKKCKPAAYF